jgi:hypothetical protein
MKGKCRRCGELVPFPYMDTHLEITHGIKETMTKPDGWSLVRCPEPCFSEEFRLHMVEGVTIAICARCELEYQVFPGMIQLLPIPDRQDRR